MDATLARLREKVPSNDSGASKNTHRSSKSKLHRYTSFSPSQKNHQREYLFRTFEGFKGIQHLNRESPANLADTKISSKETAVKIHFLTRHLKFFAESS